MFDKRVALAALVLLVLLSCCHAMEAAQNKKRMTAKKEGSGSSSKSSSKASRREAREADLLAQAQTKHETGNSEEHLNSVLPNCNTDPVSAERERVRK